MFQARKELRGRGFFEIIVFDMGRMTSSELIPDISMHSYQVQFLSEDSTMHLVKDFTYSEYDALFRFNADLMNPNKKSERFAWICQRLDITVGEDGSPHLRLARDPTTPEITTPTFEESATILTGFTDIPQWEQLRGRLLSLESRRAEAVAKIEADAHQKFMTDLSRLRQEEALLSTNREARQQAEREHQRLIRAEEAAAEKLKMERDAELEKLREKNLNKPKPQKLAPTVTSIAAPKIPRAPAALKPPPENKDSQRDDAIQKIEKLRNVAELKRIAELKADAQKKVHAAKLAWERKMEKIHDDDSNRRKLFRPLLELRKQRQEEIEQFKTLNPKTIPQPKEKQLSIEEKREMNIAKKERLRNLKEVRIS